MLFVVLSNSVLYVLTVISINYVSSVVESVKHKDRGKSDLFIYIRIFSVLGFTWIFGIVAFFFQEDSPLKRVIIFLFVIFSGIQVKNGKRILIFFSVQEKALTHLKPVGDRTT